MGLKTSIRYLALKRSQKKSETTTVNREEDILDLILCKFARAIVLLGCLNKLF